MRAGILNLLYACFHSSSSLTGAVSFAEHLVWFPFCVKHLLEFWFGDIRKELNNVPSYCFSLLVHQISLDLISDSLEEPMKRLLWLLPKTEPLLNVKG